MTVVNLDTLNRLRVNAGKTELKAWKASGVKLGEAIKALQDAGFTDALPGANINAKPVTDDPAVAAVLPKDESKKKKTNSKTPHPAIKSITSTDHKTTEIKKDEPEVHHIKPQLGRGLETEPMARQSRIAVQMQRQRERDEAKEAKKEKKKEKKLAKGQVDPKKNPEKAKRQEKHIADKKKAREGKPKVDKNPNEITVADIARKLDIDPKVARAKLRRHEDKIKKLHTKGQDRWTFPKTAEAEITKILK